MTQLEKIIGDAWETRANINASNATAELRQAVDHVIAELDAGRIRVATREGVGRWTTHQWIKKAVLLSFRLTDNVIIKSGDLGFYDKVPTKFSRSTEEEMRSSGVRVVPPAVARRGCFIAKGSILMPSYVNIGAYVDEGTMVDTWATVGSCAQIGKGVHLAGGVGIGGVLEPVQANPTIIEDNCFIGARSEMLKVSLSKKIRSSQWAYTSARARKSMTALRAKSLMDACRRAPWLWLETYPRPTGSTVSTAPSSSSMSMRKPVQRLR
jgi:2,3,4,5-tetrahydropyridine-2-carboxylate N-succinyltransferase